MGWFSKEKEPEEVTPAPKPVKVKVLGVRLGRETKGSTVYNSTWYCLLVEFEDGNRELHEYRSSDPELHAFLPLISMD